MSLYQKEGSEIWYVSIEIAGRPRLRRSTRTTDKKLAQEYHDRLKAKIWEEVKLGTKPRYAWRTAVIRFIREAKIANKASLKNDQEALRWLDSYLANKYLDEINKDLIDRIIEERMKPYTVTYKSGQKRTCTPGVDTVNRFLTTFRTLLYKARDEWEVVERVPKVKALKGTKERVRWITRDQANRLVVELPEHLAAMTEFSLQTGLRRHNVTHLEWQNVDLERRTAWVLSEDIKNRKSLSVPLSEIAIEILKAQKAKQEKDGETSLFVFAKAGKPVHQTGTKAWREALIRAKIDNFRWHDLRHTWASWHVQSGTPLHVLQELGGWSSLKMVQRYAHLNGEHLREWVDRKKHPELRLVNSEVFGSRTGTHG